MRTYNSFILAKQSHPEEVAQRFGGYQDFLALLAEGLIGDFCAKRRRLEKKYKKQKIPNGASSKVQRRLLGQSGDGASQLAVGTVARYQMKNSRISITCFGPQGGMTF